MTGKELRRLRRLLKWTQARMALAVGISPNTIARQERGELSISEPLSRLVTIIVDRELGRNDQKDS